jgi:MGT family glycosyltransferase
VSRVVLFPFAPGAGLAHVGSCLAVGERLRERGHEVICAYGGTIPQLVKAADFPVESVPEITAEAAAGRWFESVEELLAQAEADRGLLERLRPDAVVVDLRVPSMLAATRAGVPALALMHFVRLTGHWREPQPWRKRARQLRHAHRVPTALRTRRRGQAVALENRALRAEARRRYGLPPAPLVDGDAVAVTSTPLLDPAVLPEHWRYVGPISWSAGADAEAIERGTRPLVYVSQGSTGSAELLRRAVRELAHEELDLVVTTARLCDPEELRALAPAARVERLLPTTTCIAAADAAVVHGGHLTTAEAHRLGTPVVVLPAGHDHWAWAERVERLGTGVALRPPVASGAVRRAVRRVLRRDSYRERAAAVAAHLAEWDGASRASDLLEELVA